MNRVQILMYHQVGDFKPMKTHRATYCHYRRFASQMKLLNYLGYHPLRLGDAVAGLYGNRTLPKNPVVLTFDDGYENFYDFAFPILKKYRYPATVFLLAGKIGGTADWLEREGHPGARLLGEDRIRELQGAGIEFGSHGVGHLRLTRLAADALVDEVKNSKSFLEDLLGQEVRYFCYPYGDYSEEAVRLVRAAGYEAALTCRRGAAESHDDPFLLPRKAVSYGDSAPGLFWKLITRNAASPAMVSGEESSAP